MGEGVPPFFGGAGIGGNFKQQYRCYSVAMSPATNPQGLEEGGKSEQTKHSMRLLLTHPW